MGRINYKVSFEEMAERGKKILENQKPVTLEEAKKQVEDIKKASKVKEEKKK
jgi:hypothetical protein